MHLSKLGFKIIEEANNLKRTKSALSKELNISTSTLNKIIYGKCKPKEAQDLIDKMLKMYPIEASKLKVIEEDKSLPFTLLNKKKAK